MDLISLIGTILAFVVLIVGTILKGSTVAALWNPAAFVIVIIGTIAAIMVQTPGKVLKAAGKLFIYVYKPPMVEIEPTIEKIIGWCEESRKKGLLGLESLIDLETDDFTQNGLRLLVDGMEPDNIRHIMDIDKDTEEHAAMNAAKVFENAGVYSPTMGIIGAVMGLMAVMQNLSDPSKLGHGIAAAFVATIYGVALANLLMLPMSARLKGHVHKRAKQREVIVEGLAGIAQGLNPRLLRSRLESFLE